jgi:hypothetical protein
LVVAAKHSSVRATIARISASDVAISLAFLVAWLLPQSIGANFGNATDQFRNR